MRFMLSTFDKHRTREYFTEYDLFIFYINVHPIQSAWVTNKGFLLKWFFDMKEKKFIGNENHEDKEGR